MVCDSARTTITPALISKVIANRITLRFIAEIMGCAMDRKGESTGRKVRVRVENKQKNSKTDVGTSCMDVYHVMCIYTANVARIPA